jgi:hypothetical protein
MSPQYQAALRATPGQTRISKADITDEIARGIIESETKARRAKTERLRALRLAQEATEAKAAEQAAAEKPTKKPAKKKT